MLILYIIPKKGAPLTSQAPHMEKVDRFVEEDVGRSRRFREGEHQEPVMTPPLTWST